MQARSAVGWRRLSRPAGGGSFPCEAALFSSAAGPILGAAQALAGTSMGPAALGGWRLLVAGVILAAPARRHLPALLRALRHGLAPPAADLRRRHRRLPGGVPLLDRPHRRRPGHRPRRHRPDRPARVRRTPHADLADLHRHRRDRLRPADGAHRNRRRRPRAAGRHGLGCLLRPVHRVRQAVGHRPPRRAPADGVRPLAAARRRSAGAMDGRGHRHARATRHAGPHRLAGAGHHRPGVLAVLRRIPSTSAAAVGTLSLAEPLAASFLGVFVLHEHLCASLLQLQV